MPSHSGSSMRSMQKKKKMPMKKKPMRKQAVVKQDKKLTQSQMGMLLKHSKLHKGGMRSKHMAIMIKEMKKGETFGKAHKLAMKG
tara:strand:+ start:271 stop:525 length:255 start_codon:yes stop_codon:yes gene_type:complete